MPSTKPPAPLPEQPSLEHLKKEAKSLVRSAREGDAVAVARIRAVRNAAPTDDRIPLAHAQFAIARAHGFRNWQELIAHVSSLTGSGLALRPLIRPVELRPGRRWQFGNGTNVATDDVFAMFVAARVGDVGTVKRLLARAPAFATVEYDYTPPIHFAVREGQREVVEMLLDHGADAAYRSYPFQESLLTFAEERGHAEVAELLRRRLSRRFDIRAGTEGLLEAATNGELARVDEHLVDRPELASASNETGDTALHRAAWAGHLDVVQALLRAGAAVDAVRGDGYRPVHCALMPNWFFQERLGSREKIADVLLEAGARYSIFIAALRGDIEFVRREIARDRSLASFEDTCHHRVLSAAVRRKDIDMTRLLLEHTADPNLAEEGAPGGLSLWIAVNDREREIVRLLLAHGADPNAYVDSSGTPMERAAGDRELEELLRAHGGRDTSPDPERERVGKLLLQGELVEAERILRENLHWIHANEADWGDGILAGPAREGRNDVIELLIRLGARVPLVSKWAPYYYFKHEATAALLLERGMDPNHMTWQRFTLLHHMAAEGEIRKAKLLLDHGADIELVDDEYRSTPLGVAARFGHLPMVELLLDRGADPDGAGASWARPLAWAEARQHESIADLLTSALGGSTENSGAAP